MSKRLTVNRLTILALLITLCHIGRIAFQFLPNIQPVTAIIILVTITMGLMEGMIVSVGSMVLSNILLGMGPWTVYQILSYIIIVLVVGSLRTYYFKLEGHDHLSRIIFALISGGAGLLYGFVISILSAHLFGVVNFWIYYIQGLPFDVMHMVGNIVFFLLLEPTLVPIIYKHIDV
ncbi:ECF transporter S component [Aerococcaceae bacterium WGS1372]